MRPSSRLPWVVFVVGLAACGDDSGGGGETFDADPNAPDAALFDADPNAPDADPNAPDGGTATCGTTECSDCIDNDDDGTIDGFDVECTLAADDDEDTFATGIPGDNQDDKKQDCFFDGNSGGCQVATCCIVDQSTCSSAELSTCTGLNDPTCFGDCGDATTPGCDCWGCCTICIGGTCSDVYIGAGGCVEAEDIGTPSCPTCTKSSECQTPCNETDANAMCVLCPGQTEDDLPEGCTTAECPSGLEVCTTDADCGTGFFCSAGCCVEIIG